MTAAKHKDSIQLGLWFQSVKVYDDRAKAWWQEQLRAHIWIHPGSERALEMMADFLSFIAHPLVTHFLQQGHTS